MQITNGWYIRLENHNAKTNRHRHYTVSWEPTLWHPDRVLGRVSGYNCPSQWAVHHMPGVGSVILGEGYFCSQTVHSTPPPVPLGFDSSQALV